jgi:Ca2+-binding RTX toxin-like protein/subtilisin-like proprotein convertase family protein
MAINSFIPTDPLYSQQWHLSLVGRLGFGTGSTNFAGLERIWADYRGQNVKVGVWDDGIQSSHWDLDANYNSSRHVTVNGTLNNGQPISSTNGHGTAVAGLIAAEANGQGGVGVAFQSELTSIRIFGGADDINSAWSRYLTTLDSLGNFDVTNHSYGAFPDFRVYGDVAKFANAAANGRGGLGTVNVKSAGNDNVDGNGEALDASRFTVTVAALSSSGQVASYSTYGAHVLVSAPAGSVTTDLLGTGAGYNGLLNGDYTNAFGGTSAAGPVTAGVVSLMLSANPGLGWRDVQNILAYSATGTGSIYGGVTTNENFAWKWNGADNWNGGGLHFSEDYGYGMVNAYNAARMAEAWNLFNATAATSANEASVTTGTITANRTIADLSTLNYTFTVSGTLMLEHVSMRVTLTHSDFTNLRISLISPEGTVMSLYDGSTGTAATSDNGLSYTFGIDGLRGELSAGTWTLRIQDAVGGDAGTLTSVNFTGFGASVTNNNVYHYTDEVIRLLAQAGQGGRLELSDTNGGTDWINASAMYRNIVLNLEAGATSTAGGNAFLRIATGTVIENAVTGDGNDTIYGNAANNIIYGMRGDDRLYGRDGDDILAGGQGNDFIDGGAGVDICLLQVSYASCTVSYDAATQQFLISSLWGGTDTIINVEIFRFTDVDRLASDWITPDTTAPILVSSTPADNATGVGVGANLSLTFNENIKAGTGNILIYTAAGALFATIAVTDSSQVSFAGKVLTINPTANLEYGTGYYINIEAGAVRDLAGNAYAGIVNNTDLSFNTTEYTATGNSSANTLNGTAGADKLYGMGGNDTLRGYAGDDLLDGGSGYDTMYGGAGDDTYIVNSTGDRVVELANEGIDTVRSSVSLTLPANVENLVLTGTSSLTGTGNELDNTITGNSAANRLYGRGGNDTLNGGAGNDTLYGEAGDDTLVGGLGNDVLVGGPGADAFVFNVALTSANRDTINDFNPIDDIFLLDRKVFSALTLGALHPDQLRIGSAAQDADDRIIYNPSTGALSYDSDGVGGAAALQFATLGKNLALTASDFEII